MPQTFYAGPKRAKWINFVFTTPSKTIDLPNWLAYFWSKGAISVDGVDQLMDRIISNTNEHHAKIALLVIYAHANPSVVCIGKDRVTLENFESFRKRLESIKACFVPGVSFVHFAACQLGQNAPLLMEFSKAWGGVEVRAFVDYQFVEDEIPVGKGAFVTCVSTLCTPSL